MCEVEDVENSFRILSETQYENEIHVLETDQKSISYLKIYKEGY